MLIIEGRLEADLLRLTLERAPKEAVGLIIDGFVVELPNTHPTPESAFQVDRRDIISTLRAYPAASAVTFWHSHPAGGVGPSRIDIQHKTPFPTHLVVTLSEGEIIPTWY